MFANRTLGDQSDRYRRLRGGKREIVVVAGAADRVIPPSHIARIRALLPPHRYLQVAEGSRLGPLGAGVHQRIRIRARTYRLLRTTSAITETIPTRASWPHAKARKMIAPAMAR